MPNDERLALNATTPMRTMDRLEDVPPDFSAFPALWRYAQKWWNAESDRDGAPDDGSAVWESADLILAVEQAEQAFPAGPDSHTLPLVLRFATLMERVLADHHSRDFDHMEPCRAGAGCDLGPEPHDVTVDDGDRMPSWRVGDPREIYGVLINACTSLARTINDKSNDSAAVGKKAAVVAVYALMLADINGAVGDWPDWQIDKARRSGHGAPPTVDGGSK